MSLSTKQHEAALAFVRDWTRGRDQVALSDADRAVSNAGLSFKVEQRQVAALIRMLGFYKIGWEGTCYDRTPLYQRKSGPLL